MRQKVRAWTWGLTIAGWAVIVVGGLCALTKYSGKAGAVGLAPARWPDDLPFKPAPAGVTLVVAVHPRCSCSRATIGELARLMTRTERGLHAYALVINPEGAPDGWERGEYWNALEKIPGVTVMSDSGGAYARKLGAETSGQTYAFDANGRLLFSGGITPARGHMGDSAGSDAVTNLLLGEAPRKDRSAVFGCPLSSPSDRAEGGSRNGR